jgi:hypothetical protein
LALREPADSAARAPSIAQRLDSLIRGAPITRFVDLGSGTGSNTRYLAARTSGAQDWMLVDSDEAHLAQVHSRAAHWRAGLPSLRNVETRQIDLAPNVDALPLDKGVVVTASALLDLVSSEWLKRLLVRCHSYHATVLFALSYDGRMEFSPIEPDDEWIRDLMNRHQRSDKGFGPALGAAAVALAQTCLEDLQYVVELAPSDWVLGSSDVRIQESLLRGWAQAATEMRPSDQGRCARWLSARLGHLSRGASRMRVGHQDLIGWRPSGVV